MRVRLLKNLNNMAKKTKKRPKPLPRNTTPRSRRYEDGGKLK